MWLRTLACCSLALGVVACGEGSDDRPTPDTRIDQQPDELTNDAHARFVFSSIGIANQFFCAVDGGTPAACVPPVELDLDDGEHTFEVAAGLDVHVDETPASFTWRIDTAAPDTTLLAAPPAIDNDPEPEFSFEGSDAEGPVTFECALDDATAATCASPFAVPVVDGNHTFTITAVDAAGNRDASPVVHAWEVNTVTPDTAFLIAPSVGEVTGNDVTVTFESPDPEATFECSLDGAAFAPCTSPLVLEGLGDGEHVLEVRAVGVAGADPSPATVTWTVDATPPEVTITGQPTNPSNDTTPAFTFTANEAATFECQIDGVVAFTACASPFESPALADGTRTFRVRATDTVGNTGTAATFAWVVDTVAPTVTITAEPATLSSDSSPTVTFTTAGAPTQIDCQLDAGGFAACTSPKTFTGVADGPHTITVRVTDAAGNASTDTTATFTIDTAAPTVTITAEPATLSNDDSPSVTFTTAGAPTVIQCRLDTASFAACTSPKTFSNVADGPHTITVRVADGAGNASTDTTATFTIDTVAPTVTIATEPVTLSSDDSPTVTFNTAGAPTKIDCQLDAGNFAACTSPKTFTSVADGPHTITVRVTDGAGNASTDTTATFTIDTAAPTVTITEEPAALSNDDSPSVTFTTAGAPTKIECQLDAGTFAACTSPRTFSNVADGDHTISVRVTDGAGNASTDTTATFTIDTAAPTVTITEEPATLSNDNSPTVTFTTAGAPTKIECRRDTGTFAPCTSPKTFTSVPDGAHTISVRVTDGAGNASTDTTASFRIDTVAPVVTFDDAPPAAWPVNYFDVLFSVSETATVTCSLDGATFTACASPVALTDIPYDSLSTFRVQAKDAAGNTTIASTSWTSSTGLVLHYPWEQGDANNTSLLAQNPTYSPDGPSGGAGPAVGGWAGTAIGDTVPRHIYPQTIRALTSSPDGAYTVGFWIRPVNEGASGTLLSTRDGDGGFSVEITNTTLTFTVIESDGKGFPKSTSIPTLRWTHVGLRTFGPGKGIEVFLNGGFQFTVQPPQSNGFDGRQAKDLTVGPYAGLHLDDLRFHNEALDNAAMCTVATRGLLDPNGRCGALRAGIELDFEGNTLDTGVWPLTVQTPEQFSFEDGNLGARLRTAVSQAWGIRPGNAKFSSQVTFLPARSFTLWFLADPTRPGTLVDFTRTSVGSPFTGGIRVSYTDSNKVVVFAGNGNGIERTAVLDARAGAMNSVVVTEQRTDGVTQTISVMVNGGSPNVMPFGSGDVYAQVSDDLNLASTAGMQLDEFEFWPDDLSRDPELLCENGFDGLFDHTTDKCVLTSN